MNITNLYCNIALKNVSQKSQNTKTFNAGLCGQYGRSMIEMLGVLAIIGVLSVGGIFGYSKAMEKHRINVTIQQITTIINNMRTTFLTTGGEYPYAAFGPSKYSNGAGMQAAIAMNVFPSEMLGDARTVPIYSEVAVDVIKSGVIVGQEKELQKTGEADVPVVQNLYRGEVYIISEDEGKTFSLIFENLPKDVAIATGTMDWKAGDSLSFHEIFLTAEEEDEDEE